MKARKMKGKLALVLSAIFFIASKYTFAGEISPALNVNKNTTTNSSFEEEQTTVGENSTISNSMYLPYLQVGATRFFNTKSTDSAAAGLDFFVPLLQSSNDMLFTDIRFYDRSGKPFEGNIHLGYRHLSPEAQHLYGAYAAFDRNRTGLGNYFNQITLGVECWLDKLFIGGNFYQPIGKTAKFVGTEFNSVKYRDVSKNIKNLWITNDNQNEKAMGGADAMVGYEFIPGLTGYVGGYYLSAKDTTSIHGPKAKLAYDLSLNNGKRVLGIFDKVGLEAGVQNDKTRGTAWYLSANLRVGLSSDSNNELHGVSRHMVDLIHRDVDIVSATSTKSEEIPYKINGEIAKLAEVHNGAEFSAALYDKKVHIISVKGYIDNNSIDRNSLANLPNKKEIIFSDKLNISLNGKIETVQLPVNGSSQVNAGAAPKDLIDLLGKTAAIVIKPAEANEAVKNWDKSKQEGAKKSTQAPVVIDAVKKDDAVAKKLQDEQNAAKLKADQEKAKKLQDEQEAAKKLQAEKDDAVAKKLQDEQNAANLKADQEKAKKQQDEQEAAKKRQAEKDDAVAKKLQDEQDATKLKADQEKAKKLQDEQEAKLNADQEKAEKLKAEQDAVNYESQANLPASMIDGLYKNGGLSPKARQEIAVFDNEKNKVIKKLETDIDLLAKEGKFSEVDALVAKTEKELRTLREIIRTSLVIEGKYLTADIQEKHIMEKIAAANKLVNEMNIINLRNELIEQVIKIDPNTHGNANVNSIEENIARLEKDPEILQAKKTLGLESSDDIFKQQKTQLIDIRRAKIDPLLMKDIEKININDYKNIIAKFNANDALALNRVESYKNDVSAKIERAQDAKQRGMLDSNNSLVIANEVLEKTNNYYAALSDYFKAKDAYMKENTSIEELIKKLAFSPASKVIKEIQKNNKYKTSRLGFNLPDIDTSSTLNKYNDLTNLIMHLGGIKTLGSGESVKQIVDAKIVDANKILVKLGVCEENKCEIDKIIAKQLN